VRVDRGGVRGEDLPRGRRCGRALIDAEQKHFQERVQYRWGTGVPLGAGRVVLAAQVIGGEADQRRPFSLPPGDWAEGIRPGESGGTDSGRKRTSVPSRPAISSQRWTRPGRIQTMVPGSRPWRTKSTVTLPCPKSTIASTWKSVRSVDAVSDLGRAVADLLHNGAGQTVLGRLDRAAVAEVMADVLGAVPDDSLLALAEGMQGNPFFLMELLSGLREEHLVSRDAGRATLAEARLPLRVREGMRRRLARMSPAARNVAAVAASMGRRFIVSQLAAVLEVPASSLLDPVQELTGSELLAEGGEMLSFTHDLNREAVRASRPSSAVHALDRQVASALLAAGALPVEVATQLASSAAPGDEVAITTLMKASDALASTTCATPSRSWASTPASP
jgi:hypothetical protein